jgi:NADP-dependent aldehyde dehydrogenase
MQPINPINNKYIFDPIIETSKKCLSNIGTKSQEAFNLFRFETLYRRAKLLNCIGKELLNIKDELVKTCQSETALSSTRLNGELTRTINQLELFSNVVRDGAFLNPVIDYSKKNNIEVDCRSINIPIGPVVVFSASNFPLAFSVIGKNSLNTLKIKIF